MEKELNRVLILKKFKIIDNILDSSKFFCVVVVYENILFVSILILFLFKQEN